MRYVFDTFVIDAATRELLASGTSLRIEPKVFDLILHLIEHGDRMVPKDELVAAVWQGRFISDAAISSAISAARRALGDDGRRQRYIRTIHGRGFRFVNAVVQVGSTAPGPSYAAGDGRAPRAEPPSLAATTAPPYQPQRIWPSVAILPLRTAGDDPETLDMAAAITEDLVACLSRDRCLAVIAHDDESDTLNKPAVHVRSLASRIGAQYIWWREAYAALTAPWRSWCGSSTAWMPGMSG